MTFKIVNKSREEVELVATANSDLENVRGRFNELVADGEFIESVGIDKVWVNSPSFDAGMWQIQRGSNTVAVYDTSCFIDYGGNGVLLDKDNEASLKVRLLNTSSTGSITIRLKKKLTAISNLLSNYAVNGIEPPLVADFAGILNRGVEYYRKLGAVTTFNELFTHSRASNATMVDSDGKLKWAPHNFLSYSEDFTNADWTKNRCTVSSNGDGSFTVTQNADDFTGSLNKIGMSITSDAKWKMTCEAKAGTWDYIVLREQLSDGSTNATYFNINSGTIGTTNAAHAATITALSDGWYRCTIEFTNDGTARSSVLYFTLGKEDNNVIATTGDTGNTVLIRYPRVHRSDLGGMVNNPDRNDSYVPTTSSAVYLPRRNHYKWNGYEWKNSGILHESAAATNLLPISNAAYTASNGTSQSSSETTPTGQADGFEFFPNTATSTHLLTIGSGLSFDASSQYTIWRFVKARGSQQYVSLGFGVNAFNTTERYATFDIVNGVVVAQQTNVTGHIKAIGSGWYLIGTTATSKSSPTTDVGAYLLLENAASLATSYAGNTADGIYHFHAQCEKGSVPTSAIITNGATATRALETLTIAGTDMPYSSENMSLYFNAKINYADTGARTCGVFNWNAGNNDYIDFELDTTASRTGDPEFAMRQGGGSSYVPNASDTQYSPGIDILFKWAARIVASSAMQQAYNGSSDASITPGLIPDLSNSAFAFGSNLGGTSKFNGTYSLFSAWDSDLTDSGIEEATT